MSNELKHKVEVLKDIKDKTIYDSEIYDRAIKIYGESNIETFYSAFRNCVLSEKLNK